MKTTSGTPKMSEPTRRRYRSPHDVSSTSELLECVSRTQHLVLEFPTDCDRDSLDPFVVRIAIELPENYTVFHAGSFKDKVCVTIKQVVDRKAVLEMADELVFAARHFHKTATMLATDLAMHNDVPLDRLWEESHRLEDHSSNWDLFVHGKHCCFTNLSSGQKVEVDMWFGTEFGVLDPLFFFNYMKTTSSLKLPVELKDAYHDTNRALAILGEVGKLFRVQGIFESSGLTAISPTN